MTIAADTRLPFAFRARSSMRALLLDAVGQPLPAQEVVHIVVKGTSSRLLFTWVMALLATVVLPVTVTFTWALAATLWELALRPLLDQFIALAIARRNERHGLFALAAINLVGGFIYATFPFVAFQTDSAIGVIFATAWICAAANHDFVYFSSHRLLLASALTPLVVCTLAAPFMTAGLSFISAAAAIVWLAMILAAGFLGRDRVFLTDLLAKQAASRDMAEQANTAKSQFLATMSHELRTPLNAIIGYAEIIEEDTEGSPRADAAKITVSARQLLGVINSILDVSKLETGAIALQPERLRISDLLEEVREAAAPLAAKNGNVLIVHDADGLGELTADHVRLHQCIMQLVANAAKFTQRGEIRVCASRAIVAGKDAICFSITDTGIGIPEDQQAMIFEPFVQLDGSDARHYEGAGLGLALVRRIAKLMGGDVSCTSKPGAGSIFTIWVRSSEAQKSRTPRSRTFRGRRR